MRFNRSAVCHCSWRLSGGAVKAVGGVTLEPRFSLLEAVEQFCICNNVFAFSSKILQILRCRITLNALTFIQNNNAHKQDNL